LATGIGRVVATELAVLDLRKIIKRAVVVFASGEVHEFLERVDIDAGILVFQRIYFMVYLQEDKCKYAKN
jgi:hypothetical protein